MQGSNLRYDLQGAAHDEGPLASGYSTSAVSRRALPILS